jgi:hypothetical protein
MEVGERRMKNEDINLFVDISRLFACILFSHAKSQGNLIVISNQ